MRPRSSLKRGMSPAELGLGPEDFTRGFGYSIGCGPGWRDLILTALQARPPGTKIAQIKEKFGGLRVYVDIPESVPVSVAQEYHNLLFNLENESYHTCEECGKEGKSRSGSWIKTLCDEHAG